ncbi:uncharacterized protein si:ch73-70k4.1 [Corythoichthys intestinalis]|uniref:uncharacterized protein si:ch73-70k4.1 n=1 Tax=Corythoichthys intestinalis TaxID=161448 RepID=UPI0025A516E8|nr:uncharacterized protein si:ch73-70k4.1 [Corythoichthys intestinalis]
MNKRRFSNEDATDVTSPGSLETKRKLSKTHVSRSTDSDSPWWTKENLSSAEALWAMTLQSALPYFHEQQWDEVPDFPHPSAREEQLAEQQWYNLTEKVPPSPKPPPMSPQKTDFPVTFPPETKTQLDIADSSHSSVSRQDCGSKMITTEANIEKDQTYLHAVAGPSRIEEGMKQDEKRQTVRGSCFDSQTLVKDADIIEELMESEENEEKFIDSKSGEQAQEKLNSCPMCLLVFSVEASQMDRDCHLAQCLSEMNVDMSW